MKFERNEISTGLLVLATVGVLVGVVLLLAAPGLFKPLNDYQMFFDNAAGVKPGAPVLAGRAQDRPGGGDRFARADGQAARRNIPRMR